MRSRLFTLFTCLFVLFASAWPMRTAHAATLVVTNLNDSGPGSLRVAIVAAGTGDTITFQNGLSGTIILASTLNIVDDLTISGPGPDLLALNGSDAVSILYIFGSLVTAHISGLTIEHGYAYELGGGIYNDQATVYVDHCVFRNNTTLTGDGGGSGIYNKAGTLYVDDSSFLDNYSEWGVGSGIYNYGGSFSASTTVTNSTFIGNNTGGSGGAIGNTKAGTVKIINSTFYNNSGAFGGAIGTAWSWGASLTILDSTFNNNTSQWGDSATGGGIDIEENTTITLGNTILYGNHSKYGPPDIDGTVSSLGYNIIGVGTGASGWAASDQLGVDPLLSAPANNGGPTETMALQPASPAIATGNCSLGTPVSTDQRGVARKSPACDVGAYEAPYYPVVYNTRDHGGGSLRYVVTYATPGTTITFDPAVFSQPKTITLTGGGLTVHANLTISGPGAKLLAVDGNDASTVFTIPSGVAATFSGLTITHGKGQWGGGITNAGTLSLMGCVLSANSASGGGGIYSNGGTVIIIGSTFSANSASPGYGGGLYASVPVSITNSTFFGNSAYSGGGGLYVNGSGALTITNSTIASNTTATTGHGGGIYNYNGVLSLGSSIVTGNKVSSSGNPSDINGVTASLGYNLVGNTSGASGLVDSDLKNVNARLAGELADNGGHTMTMALLSNSPAIDAANDAACPPTDQRAVTRPQGAHCDIGSYEALTISGNAGVDGAVLNYNGGSAIADGNGNYVIVVPLLWNKTIIPFKPGYTFFPASRTYPGIQNSLSNQDYIAAALIYLPIVKH